MSNKKYDVCVIGAGPGGYVAAIRTGRLGAKTVLIEKEYLGGTCLNQGCIPTKTLLAGTEMFHLIKKAADFGIETKGAPAVNWNVMQDRKEDVIGKLRNGIATLLKTSGVDVITGEASFLDRKSIIVSGKKEKISADKFIIATGSEPAMPGFIPESNRVITSTQLLEISKIPKSLIVLGGGVVGCEFASLFAELGTKVTIVEMLPEIIPGLDAEISKQLSREMKKTGIKILTGNPMNKIKADKKSVTGFIGKEKVSAEYMLVSIGRTPVTDALKPETAGLKLDDKGFITVDNRCKTNVPGIYAIGDVTGRIQLAHLASAMGIVAAENACGNPDEFRDDLVPSCIFTHPEIGSVGMTAEQCKNQNREVNIGKFAFAGLGKAMAAGETTGFCKIIADTETDQVLGVHIIGSHAADLIAESATAMNLEITAKELGKAIHAHPTLSEATMEAAHAVHGECIHMPPPRQRRV
jgi:dihydrolipoamide dehydrogenase